MQMANAMKTQAQRIILARLVAAAGLLVSCSAAEDGPRGPIENPPRGRLWAPVGSGSQVPMPSTATAPTKAATSPKDLVALSCEARASHYFGPTIRAFSQKVPDRACGDDGECGDGFCDRGRCAPIREDEYGQRCTETCQCAPYVCFEGRCRSCLHHAECTGKGVGNMCGIGVPSSSIPFAYGCGGVGPHETQMPPEPVRPPPPPSP